MMREMLTHYIDRYAAYGLQFEVSMKVQKRDKTGFSIISQQLPILRPVMMFVTRSHMRDIDSFHWLDVRRSYSSVLRIRSPSIRKSVSLIGSARCTFQRSN